MAQDVKNRAAKEEAIEAIALKLFLRHGFRKVRMGDIAKACETSRPSLYAIFPNKEAIFASIVDRHTRTNLAVTQKTLKAQTGAKARLEAIVEVWIIEAYAMGVNSENAAELSNCAPTFAPEATSLMWQTVESQILETLRAEARKKRDPAVTELAHVLTWALRGAKAASVNLADLRRLVQGLIGMTLATLEKLNA